MFHFIERQKWNYYLATSGDTICGEERKKYMDIMKLCDKLFEDSDLQDIPIDYIFRVVRAVIVAMADGDCFYKDDFD